MSAAAYALVASGLLWYLTSDNSITEVFGATKSRYEPTLYDRRNEDNMLSFLLVTQVDNYIYCGTSSETSSFEKFIRAEFRVGELEHSKFSLYGC